MKKFYLILSFFLAMGGRQAAKAQDSTICNASFGASLVGNTVYFRAFDSLPGVQHTWSFGDGTPSIAGTFTPAHQYLAPGNYQVTQIVVDSARNCRDSASQFVIIPPPGPNCSLFVTEFSDSVHHLYTFAANTSFDGGATDTIRWMVNDTLAGQGDTLRLYLPAGPYTVCALQSTSDGCHSQSCLMINPQDSIPTPPPPPADTCTIAFTAVPKSHKPNQYVFSIVNHQDYDSISWMIMGLDSLSAGPFTGPSFTYTFVDSGYYLVEVQAEKKTGCAVSSSQAIQIDSIASGHGQTITSYPNPATSQTTLNVNLDANASITVQVYNSMGVQVLTRSVSGYPGNNAITLPIANLPQGVYYVELKYGDTTLRSKIQKL